MEHKLEHEASAEMITESTSENPKIVIPLKLQDVNDDCLIQIFYDLSIPDLVNMVEYDNRFLTAARKVFTKKYSKSPITVTNRPNLDPKKTSFSVQLLNHFGDLITKLKVDYMSRFHRYDNELEKVLIAKCRKTLLEVEFDNSDYLVLDELKEPFENVQKVSFIDGTLCSLLPDFCKWFPKANGLELKQMKSEKFSAYDDEGKIGNGYFSAHGKCQLFIKHYPTLTHFAVSYNDLRCNFRGISAGDAMNFINLNPQLTSVWIEKADHSKSRIHDSSCDGGICGIRGEDDCIDKVCENLPNLLNLHLIWGKGDFYKYYGSPQFKKLETLTVEYNRFKSFTEIRTDDLDVVNLVENDFNGLNFFMSLNKNAKKFNLTFEGTPNRTETEKLNDIIQKTIEMPNLMKLHLTFKNYEPDLSSIIRMLRYCKRLTKLINIEPTDAEASESFEVEFENYYAKYFKDWKMIMIRQRRNSPQGVFSKIMFEKTVSKEA